MLLGFIWNMAHAVVYGPAKYQGLGVLNPFFLQQIIYITTLITKAVCNSSTGKLFRYSAETFRVEIGIFFALTSKPYYEKTFVSYCPPCWYKSMWRLMSNAIYKLDLRKEYPDLQPLRVNDVYLMQLFVDSGFRGANLKSLNFTRKKLEVITLADIATVDRRRITQQTFQAIAGNGLRGETTFPKAVPTLAPAAIVLWQKAITKSFINLHSGRDQQMNHRSHLRDWTYPVIHNRWQWWTSPMENRLYKQEGEYWKSYKKRFGRRYYEIEMVLSVSIDTMVPVSISISAASHQIESEVSSYSVCPNSNLLSDFEDASL